MSSSATSVVRTLGKAIAFAIMGAALGFFIGTTLGIIVLAILDFVGKMQADMTISYRIIGLSTGTMGLVGGFLFGVIRDLRKQS